MTSLREAAAQALTELANARDYIWLLDDGGIGVSEEEILNKIANAITSLRTALADGDKLSPGEPMQKPYAWMAVGGTIWRHKTSEDDVPLYTAPRVPLAEWQINDLMADIDPEDRDSWSFRQGVYAAEKHHGVRK